MPLTEWCASQEDRESEETARGFGSSTITKCILGFLILVNRLQNHMTVKCASQVSWNTHIKLIMHVCWFYLILPIPLLAYFFLLMYYLKLWVYNNSCEYEQSFMYVYALCNVHYHIACESLFIFDSSLYYCTILANFIRFPFQLNIDAVAAWSFSESTRFPFHPNRRGFRWALMYYVWYPESILMYCDYWCDVTFWCFWFGEHFRYWYVFFKTR